MNERRFAILWIQRCDMVDFMQGAIRVANLPADCRVDAMATDIQRDAVGLRIWSASLPIQPIAPGCELPSFPAIFEKTQGADAPAFFFTGQ